jgi:hypothetical protein
VATSGYPVTFESWPVVPVRSRRLIVMTALLLLWCAVLGPVWLQRYLDVHAPLVARVDLYAAFVDSTPVTATLNAGGEQIAGPTTADDLRRNLML